jgi:hypothetical protein
MSVSFHWFSYIYDSPSYPPEQYAFYERCNATPPPYALTLQPRHSTLEPWEGWPPFATFLILRVSFYYGSFAINVAIDGNPATYCPPDGTII